MFNEKKIAKFKKIGALGDIKIGDWFVCASPRRVVRVIEKTTARILEGNAYKTVDAYLLDATMPTKELISKDNISVVGSHEAKNTQRIIDTSLSDAEGNATFWDDMKWQEVWTARQVIITHFPHGGAAHKDRDGRTASEVFCVDESRKNTSSKRTTPIKGVRVEVVPVYQYRVFIGMVKKI